MIGMEQVKIIIRSEIAKRKKDLSTREKGRLRTFEKDMVKITNQFLMRSGTQKAHEKLRLSLK